MTTKEILARTELDALATQLVGDGKAPNMFFVSLEGRGVITVTQDAHRAYNEWKRLAMQSKRLQPTLEDRVHGVLASVEPMDDENDTKLGVYDNFRDFIVD